MDGIQRNKTSIVPRAVWLWLLRPASRIADKLRNFRPDHFLTGSSRQNLTTDPVENLRWAVTEVGVIGVRHSEPELFDFVIGEPSDDTARSGHQNK